MIWSVLDNAVTLYMQQMAASGVSKNWDVAWKTATKDYEATLSLYNLFSIREYIFIEKHFP